MKIIPIRRFVQVEVAKEDIAEGNLSELFEFCDEQDKWRETNITKDFAGEGKSANPPFRIPAADTGTEIFFDNLELLSRYANMPLPTQETFCRTVRTAIERAGTESLFLTVKWSDTETKVLRIRLVGHHHLDIFTEDRDVKKETFVNREMYEGMVRPRNYSPRGSNGLP